MATPPTDGKVLAAEIITSLGEAFTVPTVDLSDTAFDAPAGGAGNALYDDIGTVSIDDLTDTTVGGAGAFDKLMTSHRAHLKDQYDKGLITGDQYTKAYIELTNAALTTATQILLGSDQARWQAYLAQAQARAAEIQAVIARVNLETAKYQLAAQVQQVQLLKAQDVLTKMQIASEDAKYDLTHAQKCLIEEQTEAARAQTLDTRSDGTTPIAGILAKQKDLYTEQKNSYIKDAEQKVAKMYLDGFTVQKTIDEATPPPTQLNETNINTVLTNIRASHGLT